MNGKQIHFACYAPIPAGVRELTDTENAARGVLRDAQGFYRTRGMTPELVWGLLRDPAASADDVRAAL